MAPLAPILRTAVWAVIAPLILYITLLGLATIPSVQRHALYAHKINTLWFRDINEPELFGFATGQVTPFFLKTPDEVELYAWHIAPLPLYLQNEEALSTQKPGVSEDITATESFRVLKEDPKARVVVYLHGNAGDIAQGHRPDSYHTLTDTSSYHVLTIDYRGFGHSTGAPSEPGLIQDAATLIDWVINVAGISADRIVILGQSLGTAVASGVAERYASEGVEFAGVVLVAGFSSLPKMLRGYRAAGVLHLLGPLNAWPWLLDWVERNVIWEKWHTVARLERLVHLAKTRLRLIIIAAADDADIPPEESNRLFRVAANATAKGELDPDLFASWKDERTVRTRQDAFVTTVKAEPNIIIRQELFPYGGHNDIMGSAPVALAVMRCFDLGGTVYPGKNLD
ncbi:hypothetical protein VD0004_g3332 [Verticillium dahliae]|uniref:AB hydrolase-1 domain-containing protein n=1 Tax=Verticillium dahliae TaxID=27337 RepID=A0A2J8D508_VERDA|nr:hypothetical protein VD0004_g3332 [Verticillium dahliae]PNH57375.1 hypothetical protein VD0003_g370 [Verticillium dahliae]PNH69680.1 hypothetical protein VD0001_g7100 [Verticillium dahliae]RXG43566.1 hypothetical protein VDGE_01159 [Verticillium dahliae]